MALTTQPIVHASFMLYIYFFSFQLKTGVKKEMFLVDKVSRNSHVTHDMDILDTKCTPSDPS